MTIQLGDEEILGEKKNKIKKKIEKGDPVDSSFQKDEILIHLSEQEQKKN